MTQLEDLLQQCTVQITIPGQPGWGTGFFVAPGLILTCAHVVKALAVGATARIRWQQQADFTTAELIQLEPKLDLALLQFTPTNTDLPCVYLDESLQVGQELYFFGYPDQDFDNGCPVTGSCEGFTGDVPPLIKFKQAQVRPGMSGSALLNRHTGKVCGIVKFTRDRSFDLGGGAVPTAVILSQFPQLNDLQQQFHQQDRRWADLLGTMTTDQPILQLQDIPKNVPRSGVSKFVGRDDELERLHAQLQQADHVAILAIAGMGGVGKTELAIQYTKQYENAYPGGICWLFTRDFNVGAQIVGYAQAYLGLQIPDGLELAAQVAFCWRNWIQDDVLIVLDDVVHYSRDVAPYLPPETACLKVLMTTRVKFGSPIQMFSLDVLTLGKSLELLESLVGKERIKAEQEIANTLCEWLGHLPLGLELVGRYLAEEASLSLSEMLFRLQRKADERQALKDEALRRDQDAPNWTLTAQRGVEAAFELSWEALDVRSQHLGKLLSLFALAPISWRRVEAVKQKHCEMYPEAGEFDPNELRTARRKLLRLHLLQDLSLETYRLHSLIQQFFRSKLEGGKVDVTT